MRYFDQPGLSFHALKDLGTISPGYYYRRHVTKELAGYSSKSMDFGTAVHIAVLEPERFTSEIIICPAEFITPGGELSTKKEARTWRESLDPYAIVLSPFDAARAQHMASRVRAHHSASSILFEARCEQEVFTTRAHSISVKAKIDIIDSTHAVWDLKTIKNLDDIKQQVRDLHYVEQVTWYADLAEGHPGGLIVIESDEPHRVQMVLFTPEAVAMAITRWRSWLDQYSTCQETGDWFNDPHDPLIISVDDLS